MTHAFGGDRALGTVGITDTMIAASRVQAHHTALEEVRPKQQEKIRHIPLLFEVDHHFCGRDDWGRENRALGMSIGLYCHDDAAMQAANQYVYILHVELSARERPMFNPASPGGFHAFQPMLRHITSMERSIIFYCLASFRAHSGGASTILECGMVTEPTYTGNNRIWHGVDRHDLCYIRTTATMMIYDETNRNNRDEAAAHIR